MNKLLYMFIILFMGCSTSSIQNYNIKNTKDISLRDKIAQMIMIRVDGKFKNINHWSNDYIGNLITKYNIGGLITFSGSTHGTYHKMKTYQEKSKIPLLIASDYERGLGMFVDGTLFPSNMAVAATNDSSLAYEQGRITAFEAKSIGINMILAPVLDINNNLNNPIINFRSYGDKPETVIKYSTQFINGVQDVGLIACGKHYPGHGNTATDSHTRLPIIDISKNELYNHELLPFKEACKNNIQSIMIGHIMIPDLDDLPATFSKKITYDILRKEWNYNGLIITDALEMGALTSTTWDGESSVRAIEGGADIILLPIDGVRSIEYILKAVEEGRITEERINESYNRIINSKVKLGLFDKDGLNYPWNEVEANLLSSKHTSVSSEIAQKSITLVKNNNNLIPFNPNKYKNVTHILMSTDSDLRTRMKPFVRDIDYIHGNVKKIYVNDPLTDLNARDVINKLKDSDLVIVSMLIRISMDKGISTIHSSHDNLLKKIKELGVPVIGVSFGSPYLPNYEFLDSYICTYGYGSISFSSATNALFGRSNISGKLPVDLNSEYMFGHGIDLKKKTKIFSSKLEVDLSKPLSVINNAINDSIFPGAQIFISKGDDIILNQGFGKFSYDKDSKNVDINTIYDVASLTKVLVTTPAIMKLYQMKRIGLDFSLNQFYSKYDLGDKKDITIRQLLLHTSGLDSYYEFYKMDNIKDRESMIDYILSKPLVYEPKTKMVYSDLGMILLLDIIEKSYGSRLDKFTYRKFYRPLGMKKTFFNPSNKYISDIAPTENDDYFRNTLLKGVVHDENAYLLNGVSGHAGLFSNAYDIGIFSKMLINDGVLLGRRYLKKNIISKFTKRMNTPSGSDRTLGWDTPSQNGKSSAGDYFSSSSYGHLGFTGTSLWIDPEQDIIVVLLTNRIHPTRDKKGMYKIRRDFHNELMKIIGDNN